VTAALEAPPAEEHSQRRIEAHRAAVNKNIPLGARRIGLRGFLCVLCVLCGEAVVVLARLRTHASVTAILDARERAETYRPIPIAFATRITSEILSANVVTLATWMIGKIDSAT